MVGADKRQTLCEVSLMVEEIVLMLVTSNPKDTINLQKARTQEHRKTQDEILIEFTRNRYIPDGLNLEVEKREKSEVDKKDRQNTSNVTMRGVRATIVAVEK
jgi:hypothetical protein